MKGYPRESISVNNTRSVANICNSLVVTVFLTLLILTATIVKNIQSCDFQNKLCFEFT